MKISASIYSDKQRTLKETIQDLMDHHVDLLHVDCNDDIKVFEDIKQIRIWTSIPIDLHIITTTPEKYFKLLEENPVEYLTFQYEELPKNFKLPSNIKGKKGLAITTFTNVKVFEQYKDWDFLLVMATVPGQSGGVFDPINFTKIRSFKNAFPTKMVHVDGGVNAEVSFILRNMGVSASVSGSYLFKEASVGQALLNLTNRSIESHFKIKDFFIPIEEVSTLEVNELDFLTILKGIDAGKLGFIPILKDKKLIGIISNADIRKGLINQINQLNNINCDELINKNPLTINENETVDTMLKLINQQKFPVSYIPVVNDEAEAAGIVTFVNLIKGEL